MKNLTRWLKASFGLFALLCMWFSTFAQMPPSGGSPDPVNSFTGLADGFDCRNSTYLVQCFGTPWQVIKQRYYFDQRAMHCGNATGAINVPANQTAEMDAIFDLPAGRTYNISVLTGLIGGAASSLKVYSNTGNGFQLQDTQVGAGWPAPYLGGPDVRFGAWKKVQFQITTGQAGLILAFQYTAGYDAGYSNFGSNGAAVDWLVIDDASGGNTAVPPVLYREINPVYSSVGYGYNTVYGDVEGYASLSFSARTDTDPSSGVYKLYYCDSITANPTVWTLQSYAGANMHKNYPGNRWVIYLPPTSTPRYYKLMKP